MVVGATPDEMRAHGYRSVGSHFPVFLHPRTNEQYALARTERKTGAGHQHFAWQADDVSLEQDLARRDLTINAIAKDGDTLIDPFGGRADIESRLLRHVSPAFAEDPLRVFRVARFAATLGDFAIHADTLALMRAMRGELAALSGERVWGELVKAAPHLGRFFEVVGELDGAHWFGGLDSLATAALFRHRNFGARSALAAVGWANEPQAVAATYAALKAPIIFQRAAKAVASHGRSLTNPPTAAVLHDALAAIGAFRQGEVAPLVLNAVAACAGTDPAPLRHLVEELNEVRLDVEPGPAYGAALKAHRIECIDAWLLSRPPAAPSSASAP